MSLFEREKSPVMHAARLCELFVAGTEVLNNMFQNNVSLTFHEWSTRLGKIAEMEETLRSDAQRMWLWDALRTEPLFKRRFGELPAATVPWTSKDQRFRVFNDGQWFVIGMKGTDVAALMEAGGRAPGDATVSVWTEEPLEMRPGKEDRLECCDCKAIVTIRVDKTFSVEREADIMRIDSDQITVGDRVLTVKVASLNQAYTISSRRLEPERRSHGGRTYDHVVHVIGTNRTRLEDICRKVETGAWEMPPPSATNIMS